MVVVIWYGWLYGSEAPVLPVHASVTGEKRGVARVRGWPWECDYFSAFETLGVLVCGGKLPGQPSLELTVRSAELLFAAFGQVP
jgi:hypothetical protein